MSGNEGGVDPFKEGNLTKSEAVEMFRHYTSPFKAEFYDKFGMQVFCFLFFVFCFLFFVFCFLFFVFCFLFLFLFFFFLSFSFALLLFLLLQPNMLTLFSFLLFFFIPSSPWEKEKDQGYMTWKEMKKKFILCIIYM